MTYGCVVCATILDLPASQLTAAEEEPAKDEDSDTSDSEEEDSSPLEERQWRSIEEYRRAVIAGLRYRLMSSSNSTELAGIRIYVKDDRVVCVMWGNPELDTWNALKGRIFLFLVGPATLTSTRNHMVASKSDCRTVGHVRLEREFLGYCQHVVEEEWSMELLAEKRPFMTINRDDGPVDIVDYYGNLPPFKLSAFCFPRVIPAPWKGGANGDARSEPKKPQDPKKDVL